MLLEALWHEFKSRCPQELLYADDLVLIAGSMEELIEKFKKWKEGMETKRLWIYMKKTKIIMIDTGSVRSLGRWPCPGLVATPSSVE